MVGSAGLEADATYNDLVVTAAVKALQRRLDELYPSLGIRPSGIVGPLTVRGFALVQRDNGLTVDGICGPQTVRAMMMSLIQSTAAMYGIPVWPLIGIVGAESGWDPGAVGVGTPYDTGPCQINRDAHPAVTLEQACDWRFAFGWTAREFKTQRDRIAQIARPGMDLDELAVAAHNSPKAARRWAETGRPGTSPNPEAYVAKVRKAWKEAP
nr:peptidoglycan-binding protein [Kineosporia babensis]